MNPIQPQRPAARKPAAAGHEEIRRHKPKKAKVPMVGLFFVVDGKPWVEGMPFAENPSVSGFRTYGVDHPDFWRCLQDSGAASKDMPYEEVPRGRVNFEDASGRFTLFADRLIIRRKQLVRNIMAALALPKDTRVVTDAHYKCAVCTGKRPTRRQEREDWGF